MELNANFESRVSVHAAKNPWVASPMVGVDRRMLDRLGDEVARATSIVRYAPGSRFSPHVHTGGEEFFVLEGVFQDEHGDYPAGTYVRNPPTTSHTPGSEEGCVIFVKLWQFDMQDRTQFSVDTTGDGYVAIAEGIRRMALHKDTLEEVYTEQWAPGVSAVLDAAQGLEVLVLEGSFVDEKEHFEQQSWLRLPVGTSCSVTAGPNGAKVWVKRNHLAQVPTPPQVS
ncbi:MAG: cupin domain-containing protein [Roseobacter sp.]